MENAAQDWVGLKFFGEARGLVDGFEEGAEELFELVGVGFEFAAFEGEEVAEELGVEAELIGAGDGGGFVVGALAGFQFDERAERGEERGDGVGEGFLELFGAASALEIKGARAEEKILQFARALAAEAVAGGFELRENFAAHERAVVALNVGELDGKDFGGDGQLGLGEREEGEGKIVAGVFECGDEGVERGEWRVAEDDEDVDVGVAGDEFAFGQTAVKRDSDELLAERGGELIAEAGEAGADGFGQRGVGFPVGGHEGECSGGGGEWGEISDS